MMASCIKLDRIIPFYKSEKSDLENSASQRARNHSETHTDSGDVVRDVIIGFADGLTVPFALTAGLSS
jgi:vacuolar iron transporter family protein